MHQYRTDLDAQALKLLGGLKYDPGYLLLLDLLQAKLDTLTEELGDRTLSSDQAANLLRYWQAFRDFLNTLKTAPVNFFQQAEEETPAEEPHPLSENVWARLQTSAQQYLEDQLGQ